MGFRNTKMLCSAAVRLCALAFLFYPAARAAAQYVNVPQTVVAPIGIVQNCTGRECLQGSGTLVEKGNGRGLVLTTGHVLALGQGKLLVTLAGQSYEATLLGHDAELDLSMLEIAEPPIEPLRLADAPPQPGQRIQSFGYGTGKLACNIGQVLGYVTEQGKPHLAGGMFEIRGNAWQGDSGGPMTTERYELCGVIRGGGPGLVNGVACGFVRRFVDRFRGRCGRPPMPSYQVQPAAPPAADQPVPTYRQPAQQTQPPMPPPEIYQQPLPQPGAYSSTSPTPPRQQQPYSAQQMQPPAGGRQPSRDLPALADQLARERAETEAALKQIPARPAAAPTNAVPAGTAAAEPSAAAGGAAAVPPPTTHHQPPTTIVRSLGQQAATRVLIAVGLPEVVAGLAAAGGVWWLGRRVQKFWSARQPAAAARVAAVTELRLERIPTTDHDFNLLQDAMAREARYEPKHAVVIERILSLYQQLKTGAPQQAVSRQGSGLGWQDRPTS